MTRLRHEGGFAMQWVVLLTSFLVLLSITTVELVRAESSGSADARLRTAVFHTAEAGMDDFLSKLPDDKTFYYRNVHPAESTRRPTSGADVDPLTTGCEIDANGRKQDPATSASIALTQWTGSITWAYPNGKDNWCAISIDGRSYEYNLQVTPPSASNLNIRIVATGRPAGSTDTSQWRAIEEWVRFSIISDFQMITSGDYRAGSTATTNGKVYAGRDIIHGGVANADLFAERNIYGPGTLNPPAVKYDQTNIRSVLDNTIDFNTFTSSLDDIQRAAQASGHYLDASAAAYRIVFSASGTYTVQSCSLTSGNDPGKTGPTCGAATTKTVPVNGAIFSEKTAVVSGIVDGRVTIATNFDVVVEDEISYEAVGDDVLGLIGKDEVIIAKYAPDTLNWRAAVIAQNGARHSWDSSGSHTLANHIGSTASKGQPFMDQFDVRDYYYDNPLQYLPPPWFPVLDEAYEVNLFREVAP